MEMNKRLKVSDGGEIYLPEHIIQHIQSFLDGKQAARTTVVSRSWYQAWLTRPNIDFNELYFRRGGIFEFHRFWSYTTTTIERYESLNLKIESLRLQVPGGFAFAFSNLLVKVANMGIQDIELISDSLQFQFPFEVLQAKTLVRLSVTKWGILRPPATVTENLSKVKSLTLEDVEVGGDCFSLMFPCLEDLTMKGCRVTQPIDISSDSLKCIRLELVSKLRAKFNVPKIRRFQLLESCYPTKFPRLSFSTGSTEWESTLSFEYTRRTHVGPSWPRLLKRFLNKFRKSKISLSFNFRCTNVCCGFGEVKGRQGPAVENLTLIVKSLPRNLPHFLAGLMWCCRPNFITLDRSNYTFAKQEEEANNGFIEFMSKELWEDGGRCCSEIESKFVNRGLTRVRLERFDAIRGGWQPLHLYTLWKPKDKQNIRFRFVWAC